MEQINTEQFNQLVRGEGRPCLVLFTKDDCQICKFVKPMLERIEASHDYGDSFYFYLVDVAQDHALFKEDLGLAGIPQVLYFKDGKKAGKLVGKHGQGEYSALVERIAQRPPAAAQPMQEPPGQKAEAEEDAAANESDGLFGKLRKAFGR